MMADPAMCRRHVRLGGIDYRIRRNELRQKWKVSFYFDQRKRNPSKIVVILRAAAAR